VIGKIVNTYRFIRYNIELGKVRFLRKFNSINSENTILEYIYEEYLEKVLEGEIFPESKYGYQSVFSNEKENIFLRFRRVGNGRLSNADEQYLISQLKNKIGRWYVPYVLSVVNDFSENLMKELLETAIRIYDPSYNYCFIKPAMRVYNFQVYDYYIDRFCNSTFNEKKGIFRALYWVIPQAVWRKETGRIETDYSVKYIWNKRGYFELDYNSSEVELIRYNDEIIQRNEKKVKIFIEEYRKTKNRKLKYYISLNLPKEINEFPDTLKRMGDEYLQEIKTKK
jgi:hypothetical protein